ncbi:class I SAM-dependent methyltransferase [Wenyingzhuangia sp. IMCC45574]
MELTRRPLQGTVNIIRFNWHFYAISLGLISLNTLLLDYRLTPYVNSSILIPLILSLAVSCYIYDYSNLYELPWLDNLNNTKILNVSAGFDETSELLKQKYPKATISKCDFHEPDKHTEVSIERARKIFPPSPETINVSTKQLPFASDSFDTILITFSAHEIRNEKERIHFFGELNRILKSNGTIYVTEHLRDIPNLMAYTIGIFHFYSKKSWIKAFTKSKLSIQQEIKTTPFISTFKLCKHGTTS